MPLKGDVKQPDEPPERGGINRLTCRILRLDGTPTPNRASMRRRLGAEQKADGTTSKPGLDAAEARSGTEGGPYAAGPPSSLWRRYYAGRRTGVGSKQMPYSALPEPMLARSSLLPTGSGYSFEVKWDGFRAIVSTEGPLRVRSRRGWSMREQAAFLADLPVRAVLDGELVAFGEDGRPDFPLLCECVLHRHAEIPLAFVAFDVLSVEGRSVTGEPYSERRLILEQMQLEGPCWSTPEAFEDGATLWEAVCEHELEGVVAKRRSGRYLPGERGWIKTKNRAYWRWELEGEAAIRSRSPRNANRLSLT
jgi:hypothetical protein